MKQFKLVATGGTFDHFHRGHEALLKKAFEVGERVIIGVTTEAMLRHKLLTSLIESYNTRKQNVLQFLKNNKLVDRATVVLLTNPYGSLKTDPTIEAVVVGPTYTQGVIEDVGGHLMVVRCDPVYATDGSILSSSRIRSGEINREGVVYALPVSPLVLPKILRSQLKNPLGTLYKTIEIDHINNPKFLITIGDISTRNMIALGRKPEICIVDLKVARKKTFSSLSDLGIDEKTHTALYVKNPAGTITPALVHGLRQVLGKMIKNEGYWAIQIDGEDDLATLVSVLLSPLSTVVVYGQPNEGVVLVEVTEEKKQKVFSLLTQFIPH